MTDDLIYVGRRSRYESILEHDTFFFFREVVDSRTCWPPSLTTMIKDDLNMSKLVLWWSHNPIVICNNGGYTGAVCLFNVRHRNVCDAVHSITNRIWPSDNLMWWMTKKNTITRERSWYVEERWPVSYPKAHYGLVLGFNWHTVKFTMHFFRDCLLEGQPNKGERTERVIPSDRIIFLGNSVKVWNVDIYPVS